ncbi:ribose-5-phosphate isomerase A [Lentibacillus kapialis]|uniref:Ribose-5-phosphate isomerase A n=1 Tax=Lentibacillus kapialis TaxID=340214 RepID=A0A917PPZ5_9BACI|nr:ribose-5-phosphate isomerase RpiA [Lentibacillus kapialis]GGJ87341.1 ribose-5-phosphate isomerase A [Lentibacillus kapialis]
MTNQDNAKKLAGEASLSHIENGMTIGLGSGSTVYWMIRKLGEHVKAGLDVKGIPSSGQSVAWANEYGVPITDFSRTQRVDVAIDGADEVDGQWNLIKGGGGALVREKIIAVTARKFVVIVDESKLVSRLGDFMLPVEILPFGREVTAGRIAELGGLAKLRRNDDNGVFISDNGNYILDCDFGGIQEPKALHHQLKQLTGVVESGLFPGMADEVMVGYSDRVSVLHD